MDAQIERIKPRDILESYGALLTIDDVSKIVRRGRTSLRSAVAEGSFPSPVLAGCLGKTSLRWHASDVAAWINSRQPATEAA